MATRLPFLFAFLILATACGQEAPKRQAEPIRFRVVDAQGKPASWAQVLLRRSKQDVASKWDADTATLILPRESAPHAVRVAARGHRLLIVNDVRDDQTLTLPPGLVVRIEMQDNGIEPPPGSALLLRIRPWVSGDPGTSAKLSAKITQTCDLMLLVKGQEESPFPILPTAHWGFGMTPTDAHNGVHVPKPGSYVVHWGLVDLERLEVQTWFTLEKSTALRFEVKDQAEPQVFQLVIDDETMQAVDRGLQRRIDAIEAAQAAEAAAKEEAAKSEEEKK